MNKYYMKLREDFLKILLMMREDKVYDVFSRLGMIENCYDTILLMLNRKAMKIGKIDLYSDNMLELLDFIDDKEELEEYVFLILEYFNIFLEKRLVWEVKDKEEFDGTKITSLNFIDFFITEKDNTKGEDIVFLFDELKKEEYNKDNMIGAFKNKTFIKDKNNRK